MLLVRILLLSVALSALGVAGQENVTSGTTGNVNATSSPGVTLRTVLFPVKDLGERRKVTTLPPEKHRPTPSTEELEAAKNAKYYFSSDVEDHSRDLTQHRDELRDGLKVKGSYSYSDGFLKRKVVYEADENGYRVISDVITPIIDGLKGKRNGTATVRSEADGEVFNYTVNSIPGKESTPT